MIDKANHYFEQLGGFCFRYRLFVVITAGLLMAVCILASKDIRYDNSFGAYFDQDDQIYTDFLKFRDNFGSDEISYILYEVPGKAYGPWDIDIMRKIVKLTRLIEQNVPFTKRVISLANVEFIEGENNNLIVHDLLLHFPKTQEALLAIRDKVLRRPSFQNGLVSKDGQYAAIIIEMDRSSIDSLEELQVDASKGARLDNLYPQATNTAITKLLSRSDFSDIRFYHTGDVPVNSVYNATVVTEAIRLGIISFLIIGALLFFFFRNLISIVGSLIVVFCSIVITTTFIKAMGWHCDLIFIILPTILIAVGVADAVHILSEKRTFEYTGHSRNSAIKKTLFIVGLPCFFTSITTIAGFYSMSISPIKAISHFAVYTGVGVFGAFLLSMTLLVALISFQRGKNNLSPPKAISSTSDPETLIHHFLKKIININIRYTKVVLWISAGCVLLAIIGIFRLSVDTNFLNEFSEDVPVRQRTEFVDRVMGGTSSMSFIFDTETEDGILDPKILADIEALQEMANTKDIVMKTYSVIDLLKEINQTLHNEDPYYYRVPKSREEIAQYLLLYEMSGGKELFNYITTDYAMANLEVRCKNVNASEYKALVDELTTAMRYRPEVKTEPRLTGMGALWIKLIEYILQSQIRGFLLAYGVIMLMMCLLFRSVKIGFISMLPNLAPVFMTLGIMGWAGIPLDYAKLMIGCVAIGVAVDDTIHLLMRFQHEFYSCGNYEQALMRAIEHVGRALYITTTVLVAGFLVFLFSSMISLNSFGTLVATTIAFALIADFFLMPSMILILKPFGKEVKNRNG